MSNKVYTVKLTLSQIRQASDMLRYDDCYSARIDSSMFEVELLHFTPARWESFGVSVKAKELTITNGAWSRAVERAEGLLTGLRLVNEILNDKHWSCQVYGHRLVEGSL